MITLSPDTAEKIFVVVVTALLYLVISGLVHLLKKRE